MNRRDQLQKICAPLAESVAAADKYTDHLEELFDVIVPERIGTAFLQALSANDYAAAVHICAEYYRNKADCPVHELTAKGYYNLNAVENYLTGRVCSVSIDWEFPNGQFDFLFNPTLEQGPINHEWLWQFNRHSEWQGLARAYRDTGDERYARFFNMLLPKWIAQTDCPAKWNAPGSAWRTIECGIRLQHQWQIAFDGFRSSQSVTDVTLLLMISSMHRQAVHLAAHPTGKNWLMMEMNGLYAFASLFPELSDSEAHRAFATKSLLEALEGQILPDGMHDELSPDYQSVVMHCTADFYNLAVRLGQADEIPASFVELMHRTAHAAVLLSTPALIQPKTNDCFAITTKSFTASAAAKVGDRPEYRFVNTNRAEGAPPLGKTASAFLPYAGFAVMRSDWGADATYLCFDVGPLGMAHVHQDMLNIILFKGSRELIYDDGGGQYDESLVRQYAISGYGHNTVLVDGLAQYRKAPGKVDAPIDAGWITNSDFDYAVATYADTYGKEMIKPATHRREVRFCKPDFFVVSDTLSTADGGVHDYELLFHLDTLRVTVSKELKNAIISDFGQDYEIAIVPIDDDSAKVELNTFSGVTEPRMRGWYNGRNESCLHASTTVSRKVCGVKSFCFRTLLIPFKSGGAMPRVTKLADGSIAVSVGGKDHRFHSEPPEPIN
ncbi:MAG: alginate lyase family protein [Clostridia bacterium]|nr:alginate lyase family protein [Clostridia bacterium]